MSVLASLDPTARQVLQVKLEALVGVERALVEGDLDALWLLCEPRTIRVPTVPLKAAARDVLSTLDIDPADVTVEIGARVDRMPRRRVRLGPVERVPAERHSRLGVRVTLDWHQSTHTGESIGRRGEPAELRTAAEATLEALSPFVRDRLELRLIGIKRLRTFDEELLAASVDCLDSPDRRHVGTVLIAGDPLRATAKAVLSALNRVLGNYLHTPD